MKIALLNDIHFSVRNDSLIFDDYFYKFYEDIFFPYIEQHNIKTLIHLGDIVDEESLLILELHTTLETNLCDDYGKTKLIHILLIGNHDIYYRNTNKVNAVQELCTAFDGIHSYLSIEDTKIVDFDGLKILMVFMDGPENEKQIIEILNMKRMICISLLDLNGFRMMDVMVQTHGYDKKIVQRLKKHLAVTFTTRMMTVKYFI